MVAGPARDARASCGCWRTGPRSSPSADSCRSGAVLLARARRPGRGRARRRNEDHPDALPLPALGKRDRAHLATGGSEDDLVLPVGSGARLSRSYSRLARRHRRTSPSTRTCSYRIPPEGHGPGSAWARFVEWLWERYADRIAAFEVVNEPNLQLWPQRTQVDTTDLRRALGHRRDRFVRGGDDAEMIMTVDAIARRYPNGAAAVSRRRRRTRFRPRSCATRRCSHTKPTRGVLRPVRGIAAVRARRARLRRAATAGSGRSTTTPTSSASFSFATDLRTAPRGARLGGRQLDGGPEMWATEGGCRASA